MADRICAGTCRVHADGELVFPDFSLSDLSAVDRVLHRAEEDMSNLPTHEIRSDTEGEAFYLHLNLTALRPKDPTMEGMTPDRWMWEAYHLLIRTALPGKPQLRRCPMPGDRWRNHMDYVLGGRPEDVPVCGQFYIGWGACCGTAGCQKSYTQLRTIEAWQEQASKVRPSWFEEDWQACEFLRQLWQQAEDVAIQKAENAKPSALDILFQFERLVELESRGSA